MTNRMVAPGDVILLRPTGFNPRRVIRTGSSSQRARLEAEFSNFSVLPEVVRMHPPIAGLAMPFPRVAEYFVTVMPAVDTTVRERFDEVFVIEYGLAMMAGLAAETLPYQREWVILGATVDFLRRFAASPRGKLLMKEGEVRQYAPYHVYQTAKSVRLTRKDVLYQRVDPPTGELTLFAYHDVLTGV